MSVCCFLRLYFPQVFFSSLALLEGRLKGLKLELQQNWSSAVVTNWKIWIPAQVINFRYIPLNYQVLFANVVHVTPISFAELRFGG